MTIKTTSPLRWDFGWIFRFLVVFAGFVATRPALADDWGAYAIVPASAPAFVLEAVGSGKDEGAVVSIARPVGTPNQKWVITPKGNNVYSLKPSSSSTLVLAVSQGETKIGTPVVLETDKGQPWQEWSLIKNEDASYCLVPRHSPKDGLDHFGGKPSPGARVDLWTNTPGDSHLHWLIRPLAGSPTQLAGGSGESPPSNYVAPEIQPEAVLKGQIKEFVFSDSRIFPEPSDR